MTIVYVRYIKILTLLRGFRVKIAIFFTTPLSLNSQKRLEHKEKETKYRKNEQKPRSHVRIDILKYIERGLMSKVENGVLKRYLKYLPSDKFKIRRIFLVQKCRMLSEKISRRAFSKNSVQKKEKSWCFFNGVEVAEGYHGTMCRWQTNEQVFTRVKKINSHPMVFSSNPATSTWKRTGIWNEVHDRLPGRYGCTHA